MTEGLMDTIERLGRQIKEMELVEMEKDFGAALCEILAEYKRSMLKHGHFPSIHHGESVMREEHEELFDEIRRQDWSYKAMYKEAIQVAAMGLKMMLFVRDEGTRSGELI
jgi:hypothetical protein